MHRSQGVFHLQHILIGEAISLYTFLRRRKSIKIWTLTFYLDTYILSLIFFKNYVQNIRETNLKKYTHRCVLQNIFYCLCFNKKKLDFFYIEHLFAKNNQMNNVALVKSII